MLVCVRVVQVFGLHSDGGPGEGYSVAHGRNSVRMRGALHHSGNPDATCASLPTDRNVVGDVRWSQVGLFGLQKT